MANSLGFTLKTNKIMTIIDNGQKKYFGYYKDKDSCWMATPLMDAEKEVKIGRKKIKFA